MFSFSFCFSNVLGCRGRGSTIKVPFFVNKQRYWWNMNTDKDALFWYQIETKIWQLEYSKNTDLHYRADTTIAKQIFWKIMSHRLLKVQK